MSFILVLIEIFVFTFDKGPETWKYRMLELKAIQGILSYFDFKICLAVRGWFLPRHQLHHNTITRISTVLERNIFVKHGPWSAGNFASPDIERLNQPTLNDLYSRSSSNYL